MSAHSVTFEKKPLQELSISSIVSNELRLWDFSQSQFEEKNYHENLNSNGSQSSIPLQRSLAAVIVQAAMKVELKL